MALVQRSRFATFFKNLTGFRGPLDLPLVQNMQPVLDISSIRAPELDLEQAYWLLQPNSIGPVAAQFSGICAKISSGAAVIDGFSIRVAAAQAVVQVGLGAEFSGSAVNGILLNNFLAGRTPGTFTAALAIFNPISSGSLTQAASFFGTAVAWNLDIGTTGQSFIFNLPGFAVITPGTAFILQSGAVNQAVGGAIWGRWLADQQ